MGQVDFFAGQVQLVHVTLDTHLPNGQGFLDKLSSHYECKSSTKINEQEVALGKQNVGAVCLKDVLEFKLFYF